MKKHSSVIWKRIAICFVCSILVISGFGNSGVKRAYAASNIKLNKNKITLRVGKYKQLKLKGAKGWISWNSTNKKVATVSSTGLVKAKKKGKATINVFFKKKVFSCQVKVKKKINKSNQSSGSDNGTESSSSTTTTSTASVVTIPAITVDKNALNVVHTGEATWYGTDELNGYTSGCAGLTTMIQSETIDGDPTKPLYICALNQPDFRSGMQGAYLRITDEQGDSVDVLVSDMLGPQAPLGDVDLDRKAFPVIEPPSTGRIKITWKIIPYPTVKPIQYMFNENSNKYMAQVQVRNHRYPVVSLEYKNASDPDSSYKTLPKTYYNYYTMTSPGDGPFTFRTTDILGHVLTDTVALSPGEVINGKENFAY
ncbi:MAG: Ig-like domain-containing protein [Lachnospiraceae bacterium]|nr:Ig-like domain-containing protein [Lachnospiraceae bacterium]